MREQIVERAIRLFNERGVEYVGIRELAKDLGVKGGNITYYFPTKDDLVAGVAARLRERNDATLRLPEEPSLGAYIEMLARAFRNHYAFRGLFLSMPNLLLRNEKLAAGYVGSTETARRRVMRDYLARLREAGWLRSDVTDDAVDRAVTFIALVSRSWIGDASISFRGADPEWCMRHYLEIVIDHLAALASAQGRRELARIRSGAFHGTEPLVSAGS